MEQPSKKTLTTAIYFLIERFVQLQELCLQVIQKYRLYWVDTTKRHPSKEYVSATQLGFWGKGNEWKYFLHGVGCRLTHSITGEIIDWDAPNVLRFDLNWFVVWLTWFLKQNMLSKEPIEHQVTSIILSAGYEPDCETLRRKIAGVLEQLHQEGKLDYFPDRTNSYELIISESDTPEHF